MDFDKFRDRGYTTRINQKQHVITRWREAVIRRRADSQAATTTPYDGKVQKSLLRVGVMGCRHRTDQDSSIDMRRVIGDAKTMDDMADLVGECVELGEVYFQPLQLDGMIRALVGLLCVAGN